MSDKFTGQTKELTMRFVLSSAQHWPKYVNFLLQLVNSSVELHVCSLYLLAVMRDLNEYYKVAARPCIVHESYMARKEHDQRMHGYLPHPDTSYH